MKLLPCLALLLLLSSPALAQQAAPAASSAAPAEAALPEVVLETSLGSIRIELYPERAPRTVANFLAYVKDGFYDGTVFHRVVPGFLAQGGIYDQNLREKQTRPAIPDETDNGLSNLRGTVAAARAPEVADSATAQFFINLVDNRRLDYVSDRNALTQGYTVFGKVIEGMDAVDAMAELPTVALGPFAGDVPQPLVVILHASIVGQEPPAPAASVAPAASSAQPADPATASSVAQ